MTDQQDAFRSEMRIEARPEVVFTYFTDPAKMARWMGVDHKLDPVPGGVFLVDVNGRDTTMGEYLEVDAPRRVVFTWGWRDSTELPPGSSTVEVDLIPTATPPWSSSFTGAFRPGRWPATPRAGAITCPGWP